MPDDDDLERAARRMVAMMGIDLALFRMAVMEAAMKAAHKEKPPTLKQIAETYDRLKQQQGHA
jgi:hypothetical protein